MRSIFVALTCCCFSANLFGETVNWTPGATIPLPPSTSVGVNVDTMVASGPNAGNAVATWADVATFAPFFSIYGNGVWSTGAISLSGAVFNNVYATVGPNAGNLVATWCNLDQDPSFSVFDGSMWTPEAQIPLGSSTSGAFLDVVVASGPNPGEVMVVWTGLPSFKPYYSIYSGGIWTTNTISLVVSGGTNSTGSTDFIFVAPGPTPGSMIATWEDVGTGHPYYSIFSGGTWTTGTIPLLAGTTGVLNVAAANGPLSGQVAASFVDKNTFNIFVSIYENGLWTTTAVPMGTSIGADHAAYMAAQATGQLVLTWGNLMTKQPYYAILENGVWSTGAQIPLGASAGDHLDVAVASLLNTNTMVATWNDIFSTLPFYSTFVGSLPPVPPPPPPPISLFPPTNGQGTHVTDRFALLVEWTNNLQWTASTSVGVTGYNIRRNGVLIGTNIAQNTYSDHNRPKKGVDVYSITSVNGSGSESLSALEITVTYL